MASPESPDSGESRGTDRRRAAAANMTALRYGGVGIEFVLTILLVSALGHWLDTRYWGGHGGGLAGGFFFGVVVAFRNLLRTAHQMQRDVERAEARDPEAHRWKVEEGWLHGEPPDPSASSDPADVADSSHPDHNGRGSNHGSSLH